ncbi:MAG: MinD/ParA family protein [Bdellovibrionales bacterium]|nr:MinD/ParA family protein [Bdellovibrionales bacterium]
MSYAWSGEESNLITRTLTITSGKGGVGKTTLVCNLALQLGRQGSRVLILDGDLGMANVDLMFGKRAKFTLFDVLEGRASMNEVVMEVAPNVDLIPSGSGVRELTRLADHQRRFLMDEVGSLPNHYDYLIVDTAPGIDDNVLYLNSAAQEINVVVTPDPASITDAYALIKVMNKYYKESKFSIIANMVRDEQEALSIFRGLSDVASEFLCVSLDFKGFVPNDQYLRSATKSQQLVLRTSGNSPSGQALVSLADKLSAFKGMEDLKGNVQFFWSQFFGVA